ncbi:MAG: hypothetical protein R3282_09990, partial [Rhodothermales bacterium]|nr:hypothetical protein [Rhodothermales bacterium]
SNLDLSAAIDAHADLIYTAARNVGHGPWSVWYDHPLLAGWLFSKQRVIPDVISIEAPSEGSVWSGVNTVMWTSTGASADTVEVWLSTDAGKTWDMAGAATIGDSMFALDTSAWPDAAVARIRLLVRNDAGRVYGRDTGVAFTIDNDGDAAPYVFLDDESLRFDPVTVSDTLRLTVVAADPEGALLTAEIFYSVDAGVSYALADNQALDSSPDAQIISLDLSHLPNSADARLRVEVSDGTTSSSATTASFRKETPRIVNDYVEHVAGEGTGTVTLHFVEPDELTNHRYRISFESDTPNGKTYSVADIQTNTTVLEDIPLSDGVRESPIFDGMSLVVEDLAVGMPNLEETGWVEGETDLGVSVVGGRVLIAILRVQLLETENDYEITVTDAVADTSVALFRMPAQELYFTVTSRSDGQRRKVMYRDAAGDGRLGGGDLLYILEEDEGGELAPAWEVRFSETAETVLPVAGDRFLFVPLRKLSNADVFEFIAMLGVGTEGVPAPTVVDLQHYPNPFRGHATIAFTLSRESRVSLEV